MTGLFKRVHLNTVYALEFVFGRTKKQKKGTSGN
jgi:hypothetical protein